MKFFHVDVFSSKPMRGNGLTVVFPEGQLSDKTLLEITREFRQFETIFIYEKNDQGTYPVRIFTMDEELEFAGHPILGAAAIIHKCFFSSKDSVQITLDLSGRAVEINSSFSEGLYDVTMNQGSPQFIKKIDKCYYKQIADALNISECDIDEKFSIEVVSTGLPYLLVPLKSNLLNSKISMKDFENYLSQFEAKFVYVFDTKTLECRTWDNNGTTEDIATGSAAGPLCAYLVKNKFRNYNEIISINQGKFINRPSIIRGWVSQNPKGQEVLISGRVSIFASGQLRVFSEGYEVIDEIKKHVHMCYWDWDINCARTTLYCLSKLFNQEISEQTMSAAIGLHGAGGFRAQCGLVEGALMFIGIYFSHNGSSESQISDICYHLAETFEKKFGSLRCSDLRPDGFRETDPPHACERITCEAIYFVYTYIKLIA